MYNRTTFCKQTKSKRKKRNIRIYIKVLVGSEKVGIFAYFFFNMCFCSKKTYLKKQDNGIGLSWG